MKIKSEIVKKDSDRLFEDLFGNLYNLFEDDLKEIKDINAVSIGLYLELFNKITCESIDLGKFSVDNKGSVSIDIVLPTFPLIMFYIYCIYSGLPGVI